jgi:glycerol kinase
MGASFLAGLAEGVWNSFESLETSWGLDRRFEPLMRDEERDAARDRWRAAVERSRG